MKHATRLCAAAIGVAFLAMLPRHHAEANDWTSWGLDAARGRFSSEVTPRSEFLALWRARLPQHQEAFLEAIVASPAIADGFAIVASQDGSLRGFRAESGQEVWRVALGGAIFGSPTVSRGRVFVAASDGVVHALRLATGERLWSRNFESIFYASPVLVEDGFGQSLLLPTGFPQQRLIRLDARTGQTQWQTLAGAIGRSSQSSVAIADDLAVVAVVDGVVYGIDLATGTKRWQQDVKGAIYMASPVVSNRIVYLVTTGSNANMHALDVSTGMPLEGWPLALKAPAAKDATLSRSFALSSLTAAGDLVLVQIRVTDAIDTSGDKLIDKHELQEWLFAVAPVERVVRWKASVGTRVSQNVSDLPLFDLCPTPAAYRGSDTIWVATASSVEPLVRVFDGLSGKQVWTASLLATTRSSPAFANGKLYVATDVGSFEAFKSKSNQPPHMPTVTMSPQIVPATGAKLTWLFAPDPEQGSVSYTLRLDRDGEVLEDWELELSTAPDETTATVPGRLEVGVTYTYAVRGRDSRGALSDWSAAYTVTAMREAPVVVDGDVRDSLHVALATAQAGATIELGAGLIRLHKPLVLRPGITLSGAGAHRTFVDASGLSAAVRVAAARDASFALLRDVSLFGSAVGIEVEQDARLELRNAVIQQAHDAAVVVAKTGYADVANVTITATGTAVRSSGQSKVRNSLLFGNKKGLVAFEPGLLNSRHNDLFENGVDYENVVAGPGDLSVPVVFADKAQKDYRLIDVQPTTDQGDPDDAYDREPAPNGGAVNLGAFGNTEEAELSHVPVHDAGISEDGLLADQGAPPEPPKARAGGHGCGMSGSRSCGAGGLLFASLSLAIRFRRRTRRR